MKKLFRLETIFTALAVVLLSLMAIDVGGRVLDRMGRNVLANTVDDELLAVHEYKRTCAYARVNGSIRPIFKTNGQPMCVAAGKKGVL
jgi:non-ribosomal peptide synthetase component E (peptide arylation enzyme)